MKKLNELTDEQYAAVLEDARRLGAEHGRNAASWWEQDAIGGRASSRVDTKETARRVLQGIDDGDPLILDSLPNPNLSGEWADDMTPARLLAELGIEDTDGPMLGGLADLCTEYEDAARLAVEDEIARLCKSHLRNR